MAIANMARDAYQKGIERIQSKTLPSMWDCDAIGWHEQWGNANYAGIYASCEGIILLSRLGIIDYRNFVSKVYINNLCKAFDCNYYIDPDDDMGVAKARQQEKALNVSYKLAKFLLASSYIDENERNATITKDVYNRLYSLFDFSKNRFRIAISAKNTSDLATAIAFISMAKFLKNDDPIIDSIKKFVTDILSKDIIGSNINSMVMGIWVVSECMSFFEEETIHKTVRSLKKVVRYGNITGETVFTEKFSVPKLNVRDSYSVNRVFVLLSSVISFIKHKLLPFEYVRFIVPHIQSIAKITSSIGAYSKDSNMANVMFWENYQAILLLSDFHELIKDENYKEETFMIVNPKLFADQDIISQDDLAVVIMPFKADWSDDIYEVFKESTGNYTTWRSDEEYTDDIIIQTVWKKINQAKFVIADCTGRNPNVFYELGIAHTLGKPVFMCSQNRADFPFDISHIRSYEYGLKPGEIKRLKADISNFISNL
jgi:hypothetical protein